MQQDGILSINSMINASEVRAHGRDLHLLAIEGRGVCALTALVALKEVLQRYQYLQKLPQIPRPCDLFDLAGGTGTGGIVAIMLFRLGMNVDEAITAYKTLSEDVFSHKPVWSNMKSTSSRLEQAIAKLVHSNLKVDVSQAQMIRMLDDEVPKCFVGASTAKNLSSSPTLFRTYVAPRHASHNCTIVEAIRATIAEDPFFPSIDIGDVNVKETFIHGGLRLNNPLRAVLQEAESIFPGQRLSLVLSIGSGVQGITGFDTTSISDLAKALKKDMNDSERISNEVAKELSDKGVCYCRLNVDHGLEDIGFKDWERLGVVKTHTRKYLEKYDVDKKVSEMVEVLNRRTWTATTVEKTLMILNQFLDGFISILPGESLSTVISEFRRFVKPGTVIATLNVHCALLQDTLASCMQGRDFAKLSDDPKGNIQRLLEGLKKMFQDAPGQEDPITYVNSNIHQLLQRFWVQNHIAGNFALHDILKYIQKDDSMKKTFTRFEQHAINQSLANLNVAPFAAHDSSEVSEKECCFKGTRVKLLNEIASWIASDDASLAPIYVLDGIAGIGKSTIAKTIAEYAAGINALGASFFFSTNDEKRKTVRTFFPTVAYQLAHYDKDFADEIDKALLRNPHVVTQMPIKQFLTLIVEPLKEFFAAARNPILIVIDALDECERGGDSLLKIFADSIKSMPRLKLFITTRPEHHIRTVLDRYYHLRRFHLQDIETSVVQSDIRLYLDFHLSKGQVRDKLPDLKCTWEPAMKDLDVLIGICGTLFIIASTAVKFILGSKISDPAKQLSRLLKGVSRQDFSGSKCTTVMDSLYTKILLAAAPDGDSDDDDDDDDDDWFGRYRIVVGTIVTLQYPLPCLALSALLNFDFDEVVRALSHLYSLVAPTGQGHDLTFRIHHKSFPDFVTSPLRCKEIKFYIDLKMRHLEVGKRCLKVLDSQLKPNICNLDSTDRFKDNKYIEHLTYDRVSQELIYASTYWATHLANVSKLDTEAKQLLEAFAHKHFLAWLEVLSLINQVDIAYPSLDRIGRLLGELKTEAGITREIVQDGCRFIALNIELIKTAAGHVFSAFAFTPQGTRLYRTYRRMKGLKLAVVSGYEEQWDPTISVMTGHAKLVNFSPDGMRLASASTDKTVRLWNGQTGAEIAVLRGHSKTIFSVVFSPDGTRLASASCDKTVRLWDTQTGAEISVLQGHSESVNSVVFSPDGMRLASASHDKTVRLWDAKTGAEIVALRGHSDGVKSVVFSPDGTRLASASRDKTIRLWNGQTGAEIARLRVHSVNSIVFSPDSMRLASSHCDYTVRLWNGQTGAEIVAPNRRHQGSVFSIVFSPDGARLASASCDRTVRLWDVQTGANIAVLQGHSGWVKSVVFSPDGTRLASASHDKTVRLWNCQTGAKIAILRGHSDRLNSVVFSPEGTRLASASDDKTVRLWDAGSEIDVPQWDDWVRSVVFSPDAKRLASASTDGTVRLWDGQTGTEIAALRGHSEWVKSVMFSPDGVRLASASCDRTVRLWDVESAAEIAVLRGHSSIVMSAVFSPDGTRLASASYDQTVRLWDGHTHAEIAVLRGHSAWVNTVVFSPDGTRIAAASYGGTVQMWDGQTGAEIAVLRGSSLWVKSIVFSPDATRLAACDDRTVRLWDVQTGAEIASLVGFLFADFSLDGSKLLSIDANEVYQVNCIADDKVTVPLGMSIGSGEGRRVHGLDLWVVLVGRKPTSKLQQREQGLLVVKVDDNSNLRFMSLCWFPPSLPVTSFDVSSVSQLAVGCNDGRVLVLDVDFSRLLYN